MTEYTKPHEFGVPDRMIENKALSKVDHVAQSHELASGRPVHLFSDESHLRRVRADFGLHMALKLAMERSIVSGAFHSPSDIGGHRLHTGCLPPSHALVSSLTGRDLEFGFKDVLNPPEFAEHMRDPHNFGEVDMKTKKKPALQSGAFI